MKESRVSEEDWKAARRRWESDATYSYAQVADSLGVSKPLVGKRSKAEGWVKDSVRGDNPAKAGVGSDPKLTQVARDPGVSAPTVDGGQVRFQAPGDAAAAQASSEMPAMPERPVFAHAGEEREWIERQVAERQDALVDKFDKEIKALTGKVYEAVRKAGSEGGWDAARSADKLAMTLERTQRMTLANEAMRTRRQLGEFCGVGPRACIIVVHVMPGFSLDGSNDDASMARRAEAAERFKEARSGAQDVEVRS
jgi:hypothetical protein